MMTHEEKVKRLDLIYTWVMNSPGRAAEVLYEAEALSKKWDTELKYTPAIVWYLMGDKQRANSYRKDLKQVLHGVGWYESEELDGF